MNMGMTSQACIPVVLLATIASACGGSLRTGTANRAGDASPEDPTCPNDTILCGTDPSDVCADIRNDPEHCGSCERACAPGVACAAGVCQRVICQGQPVISGAPITGTPRSDFTMTKAVLADVNGDGHLDLVFWQVERTSPGPGSFSVSLGQAGGGFRSPQSYTTTMGIWQVQVADVNHDGSDDLFISGLGPGGPPLHPPCMELWLGHSDAPPAPERTIPVVGCPVILAFADISGDAQPDVVATIHGEVLDVYLSDGTGNLTFSRSYSADLPYNRLVYSRSNPTDLSGNMVVKDWNGDGSPDLVVLGSSLYLHTNRGDGTFENIVDCGLALGYTTVASDFNHDGHVDLATDRGYGVGVDVLLGLGGCRFTPAAGYDLAEGCSRLQPADMDGDGQLDLVCMGGDMFTALLGNPDGSFQVAAPIRLVGASGDDAIVVGDVTGDKRPDVVVVDGNGPVGVWENTCP
jgi:hypothetical protein